MTSGIHSGITSGIAGGMTPAPHTAHTALIDAVALWSPGLPGWDVARAAFRGEGQAVTPPLRRPAAELLPAAERRRAPDTVALALEVAQHAVAGSGIDPAALLSVFTSAHGDLGLTDYVCATLAKAPLLVSPTKFHNSVHNAASGHWAMSAGCMQASTAVSAHLNSFAAGLLEALVQCAAEARPVLLVGYDMAACGALASVTASEGVLAVALVLSPERSARSRASLEWALQPGACERAALQSPAAQALQANAMADALPLFEALARGRREVVVLPLSAQLALQLNVEPLQDERSYCADEPADECADD